MQKELYSPYVNRLLSLLKYYHLKKQRKRKTNQAEFTIYQLEIMAKYTNKTCTSLFKAQTIHLLVKKRIKRLGQVRWILL